MREKRMRHTAILDSLAGDDSVCRRVQRHEEARGVQSGHQLNHLCQVGTGKETDGLENVCVTSIFGLAEPPRKSSFSCSAVDHLPVWQ
jgi:hypothetical protein